MLDRSVKPAASKNISFEIPEIEKFQLKNGLKVFLVKKTSLPIVQFNFMVNSGSINDPADKKGLAYLTALLIDEGAGSRTALELDNDIESLGSILKVSCDHDTLSVTLLTLKENLEKSFSIFSDVLLKPRFENSDFKREHKKLINKIIQADNEPSYLADNIFEKLIFADSNYMYPTMGNNKNVMNISNADVQKFYDTNFHAQNSSLIVAGNISKEEIIDIAQSNIDGMKGGKLNGFDYNFTNSNDGKIYLIHKEGAAQSEIRVGHLTNSRSHKDYYAKLLMNTTLGGQFASRLNSNLREDKGFTYGISSGFFYNKLSGQFEISTAVQSENTSAALNEIFKEIQGVKDIITDEEIAFSKSYLIKRFPGQFETYSQVSRQLATLVHYNLPDNYFNTYIDKIGNTPNEEIRNAARDYIINNSLKTVIVGDSNIVKKDLNIFSKEIIELNQQGDLPG